MTYPCLESPVIPPGPNDGRRYGVEHADEIRHNIDSVYATYRQWVADDAVPAIGVRLGTGASSEVYKAGQYACRYPHPDRRTPAVYVHDLVRGLGAPCLEQIVAASDRYTWSHIVPGDGRDRVRSEVLAQLERPAFESLLDGLTVMQARGLAIDTRGKNVLVAPEEMGIVDAHVDPGQTLVEKVGCIAHSVVGGGGIERIRHKFGEQAVKQELRDREGAAHLLSESIRNRAELFPDFWGPAVPAVDSMLLRLARAIR